jgi:hypothetical protein
MNTTTYADKYTTKAKKCTSRDQDLGLRIIVGRMALMFHTSS